jgi:hypothetical protein
MTLKAKGVDLVAPGNPLGDVYTVQTPFTELSITKQLSVGLCTLNQVDP